MTKDRQIVLMLILRKRFAYKLYRKHANNNSWNTSVRDCLYAEYCEAANAAELARRILYGHEL